MKSFKEWLIKKCDEHNSRNIYPSHEEMTPEGFIWDIIYQIILCMCIFMISYLAAGNFSVILILVIIAYLVIVILCSFWTLLS